MHAEYYLTKLEIKDYNIMIDKKTFFDQPVKSDMRTYDKTTSCLSDYNCFKKYYIMMIIDLSKDVKELSCMSHNVLLNVLENVLA